jgi:hypothetical protein
MITIDAAMTDAARQVDALIAERLDDLALALIGTGLLTPEELDDLLARQRAEAETWKAEVLQRLRASLTRTPATGPGQTRS